VRYEARRGSKGQFLFQPGDLNQWYYVLNQGRVRVTRQTAVAQLYPGTVVGEFGSHADSSLHISEAPSTYGSEPFQDISLRHDEFFVSNPGTFIRLSKNIGDKFRESIRNNETTEALS
jgi:CRP-like cAMP-binding protein